MLRDLDDAAASCPPSPQQHPTLPAQTGPGQVLTFEVASQSLTTSPLPYGFLSLRSIPSATEVNLHCDKGLLPLHVVKQPRQRRHGMMMMPRGSHDGMITDSLDLYLQSRRRSKHDRAVGQSAWKPGSTSSRLNEAAVRILISHPFAVPSTRSFLRLEKMAIGVCLAEIR